MAGADTAAAPVREALLATKLRVPRPRPGWVARARLTERLRGVTGRELVLVCGPAGFGKSSLVADWVRKHPMAAWLSLDEGDNDPVRFWRHVAAALDQVRPGLAARVEAGLGARPAALDAAVSALVNELAEAPDEVVLVVDDFHVVEIAGGCTARCDSCWTASRPPCGSCSPRAPIRRCRSRGCVSAGG